MKDNKKSRWSLNHFEKMMLPGWLFDPGNEELRRITVIAYSTVLTAVFTLTIVGSLRLIRHDTIQGLIDLSFALVMASIIIYHRKTQKHDNSLAFYMGITAFGVFCICLFLFSGFGRAAYLWSYTFPLMVFPLAGLRRGTIAMILFLVPISLLFVFDPAIPFITSYPRGFAFTFIPSILTVSGLSYLYERNREKNQKQLNLANAALRRTNEEMEQQIQERTAELAQSEENYRFLTERMSDIVWTTDLNMSVTYISPSVERTLGFTQEEYRRLLFHERLAPDSLNKAMAILAAELDQEKMPGVNPERNLQIELEFYHKSGSTVWMESMINTIRDDKGHLVGIHGLSRDITERKRVENELTIREDRFRDLFENSTDFICTHDLQGNLLSVNSTAAKSLGYAADEVIGMNIRVSLKPKYQRKFDEYLKQIKEEGAAKGVMVVRTRDGVEKILQYINTLRTEGVDEPIVRGIARDITDQWRWQKALQESEEKYRRLVENAEDAIIIVQDGVFRFVNPSLCKMSGYKMHELMQMSFIDLVHPDDRSRIMGLYQQRLKGDQTPGNYEFRGISKDGTERSLDIKPVVVDWQGRPAILVFVHDITDRKQLQEEHAQLQERLHRAEKMEALGTLAGGVAHDLNNVLGVLVGYSELLLEKLPEDSPLRRYADNILQSGVKGAAIIQDLLTLARRGVNVSEVVDLNKVVYDYLRTLEFEKLKSYHPHVKILTELEEGILNIKGSPIHLSKTIMNLVSNATEAISGKGHVTIRTENHYLDQPIQGYDEMQEGDYAVLMVSDTGSGISANDLGKIFEPFYTKKVMGRSGTGLGLAVVWGTVKDHHGYIDVQSEEGKGSTFTLYFPVTREEPLKVEKAASPSAYMSKGESILVVDDVKEQRELAMSMLGRLGYQVEAVASGEEAIEIIKNKKTDMIVLDMIMEPGIDGMETYRRILEINPGQKAVIVSGFSETGRVRKAQEMGAKAFVRKPYILEKIGLAIRKELDRE